MVLGSFLDLLGSRLTDLKPCWLVFHDALIHNLRLCLYHMPTLTRNEEHIIKKLMLRERRRSIANIYLESINGCDQKIV